MRVFHFVNEEFGLEDLRRRRLKISTLKELNDPFDLFGIDLSDEDLRRAFRLMKDELSVNRCRLCFSRDWHNHDHGHQHIDGIHSGKPDQPGHFREYHDSTEVYGDKNVPRRYDDADPDAVSGCNMVLEFIEYRSRNDRQHRSCPGGCIRYCHYYGNRSDNGRIRKHDIHDTVACIRSSLWC